MRIKKIGGIVILYHPTDGEIMNIYTYLKGLDKLWIVDNSESDLRDYSSYFKEPDRVEIIQDGYNLGIGDRINAIIRKANEEQFEWLLTMDQDSSFTDVDFSRFLKIVNEVDEDSNIALIGVRYNDFEKSAEGSFRLNPVTSIITSGTFLNLRSIEKIGLMNEELFIDEVDTEFSYRALLHGWRVMVCEGVYMTHALGTNKRTLSLKIFRKTYRSLHSPLRLYYMTRNFLWVKGHYQKYFPEEFKIRQKQLFNVYKNNLLYNSKRIKVLKMIIKGLRDFKSNKLGKFTY